MAKQAWGEARLSVYETYIYIYSLASALSVRSGVIFFASLEKHGACVRVWTNAHKFSWLISISSIYSQLRKV